MGVGSWIKSVTFSGGQKLELDEGSIVIVVGPNNAGKSSLLHELSNWFINRSGLGRVARSAELGQSGTAEEYEAWLDENMPRNAGNDASYFGFGAVINKAPIVAHWRDGQGARSLGRAACYLADAQSRLTAANPVPPINFTRDPIHHPIHLLFREESIERRLCAHFRSAFGTDLLVHRLAGNEILFLCGKEPTPDPGDDRMSPSYQRQLNKLDHLHQQGDGMRSFVGCLLSSVIPSVLILMIDEPEAFLHPPQARLIGTLLAQDKPEHRQLLIATHSGDVLRGLLDANPKSLCVVRIRREETSNVINELKPDDIRKVWSDSILRFSNVLDGLFHERVVICEGDADCRFYSAILAANADSDPTARRPDIMFTPSGGKQRVPKVAAALKSLGVPTSVVVDFDGLRDRGLLNRILDGLGQDWTPLEADWKYVANTLEQLSPPVTKEQVRRQINEILDSVNSSDLPDTATDKIADTLKAVSPWAAPKRSGLHALPSGQPIEVARRLLEGLRARGLFVVDCGELERFAPSIGGKSSWIAKVLEKDLRADPELAAARKFVADIAAFSPPGDFRPDRT